MSLKQRIHEHLLVEKEKNQEFRILENKIVKSHLLTLEKIDDSDELFESFISKVSMFQKRNFSTSVLKENVDDTIGILKSLFGDPDDSFYEELKSRLADNIVNDLKIDEEFKDCVRSEITSTPNEEISQLMSDKDFISEKITRSYVECFEDRVLATGIDQELGTAGVELRAAISKSINDDGFRQNLSGKISGQISDTLEQIKQRDEKVADEIRTTVIGR